MRVLKSNSRGMKVKLFAVEVRSTEGGQPGNGSAERSEAMRAISEFL